MEKFISCDWGTTSFRLRLVDRGTATIMAEDNSDRGIAKVFDLWKQAGQPESLRFSFFLTTIIHGIQSIERRLNHSLDGLPLVISGMACSTLGMIDLPYKEVPFAADGSDLVTEFTAATNDFKHNIIFISGARTGSDAMRGEETLLAGCFSSEQRHVYIFPGTHSKHVTITNGVVVDFKTYMTGEFFALLSEKSVLSEAIERSMENERNKRPFEDGVKESLQTNLLNSSFKVRTNYLFQKLSKQENYDYLSGLLIGTEMRELAGVDFGITLVADATLHSYYESAYNLVMNGKRRLEIQNSVHAMINGQIKVLDRLLTEKRLSGVI